MLEQKAQLKLLVRHFSRIVLYMLTIVHILGLYWVSLDIYFMLFYTNNVHIFADSLSTLPECKTIDTIRVVLTDILLTWTPAAAVLAAGQWLVPKRE